MNQLLEKLKALKNERAALATEVAGEITPDRLSEIETRSSAIDTELAHLDKQIEMQARLNSNAIQGTSGLEDELVLVGNPLGSPEYRNGFKRYVGHLMNKTELRDLSGATATSDVAPFIPITISSKIIEIVEKTGTFLSLATKTNVKGGYQVPVQELIPTATWQAEGTAATGQKLKFGVIKFGAYKLQIRLPRTFEVEKMTLEVFEQKIAEYAAKAIIKAEEAGMFIGTGEGQMTGIITTLDKPGNESLIKTITAFDYKTLLEIEGSLDEDKEENMIWAMPRKTFYSQVLSMVDSQKQPIARVSLGLDGKPVYALLGRPVKFAKPSNMGSYFGFIFDFADYFINDNDEMSARDFYDSDIDADVRQLTSLVDGQVATTQGLLGIKLSA